MKADKLNENLRTLIENLINDGYLKYNIAALTLGASRMDQINKFLDGRDMGIKPLVKFFDALGFDLHIVPIPKDSPETEKNTVNELAKEALSSAIWILSDWLENTQQLETAKQSNTSVITAATEKFLSKINPEINEDEKSSYKN